MKNAQFEPLVPLLLGLDIETPAEPIGRCFVVIDLGGYFVRSSVCSFVRSGPLLGVGGTTDLLPPLGHVDITSLSSGVSVYAFMEMIVSAIKPIDTTIIGKTYKGHTGEGSPEIDSDNQLRFGGGHGSHDCNSSVRMVVFCLMPEEGGWVGGWCM